MSARRDGLAVDQSGGPVAVPVASRRQFASVRSGGRSRPSRDMTDLPAGRSRPADPTAWQAAVGLGTGAPR